METSGAYRYKPTREGLSTLHGNLKGVSGLV